MGVDGKPLAGGVLKFYQAGTVATPQIAYQDSGLTIPVVGGSQLTCDAFGRLPQFFLADGSIKIELRDVHGVLQVTADGLLVLGASSGGGGGSPVDPTTVLQTGWLQPIYGTGIVSGFVRANGRTIGSATSGATERANADTSALFLFLYGVDTNLAVSGGRGASAAADYAANKTIALPDLRGRVIAGLDDMGNSAAGRLTATYFGSAATTLGVANGAESQTLTQAQLPNVSPTFTGTTNATISNSTTPNAPVGAIITTAAGGGSAFSAFQVGTANNNGIASAGTAVGTISALGSGNAHPNVQPTMLATFYIKL